MAVRESDLAERQRKDQEKADAIRKRQLRLGHISDPDAEEDEEEEPKPKAKPKSKSK
jgi:hypothetical protein